jgi:hypothetical protein
VKKILNIYFSIYFNIFYNNKEILYSLDSNGGWELSGIRGMSLKETGSGENPIRNATLPEAINQQATHYT